MQDPAEVDPDKHVYLRDSGVNRHFGEWKYCLMHMLLQAYIEDRESPQEEPAEVKEHTTRLLDRDNTIKAFAEERIQKSEDSKVVLLSKGVYAEYQKHCRALKIEAVRKDVFEEELSKYLGTPMIKKSGSIRNLWRGFVLVCEEVEERSECQIE